MAGFVMMPSAPFEGEVCVAGAWAIAQAQCATVFCSRKPLCLNGMWGFSTCVSFTASTIVDACLAGPQLCAW